MPKYKVTDPILVLITRSYVVECDSEDDIWDAIADYHGPVKVISEEVIQSEDVDYKEVK